MTVLVLLLVVWGLALILIGLSWLEISWTTSPIVSASFLALLLAPRRA